MDDLVRMAVFAAVVEAKSFAEAARRLGLSRSQVSKQVASLEQSLSARLLNRTTRSLSLTEAGAAYYGHCARIVDESQQAKLVVSRLQEEPRGILKSHRFGRLWHAPYRAGDSRLSRPAPWARHRHDDQRSLRGSGRGRLRPCHPHHA